MTPLRKAAIAFREALVKNDYRDIIILLYNQDFLNGSATFLKKYLSLPDSSEEEKPFEKKIKKFIDKVISESISEEELTDWQQEIILAINNAIDASQFCSIFSVQNTLTTYGDVEIAYIRLIACDNNDDFLNVIRYFSKLNQDIALREIRLFLSHLLQNRLKEADLSEWQAAIIEQINSSHFLEIFDLNYEDIYAVLSEEVVEDQSDVESLLSHDETLTGDEAIVGPSFNIPYNGRFIQGNRIHKELAGIENAYRDLFYQKRSEDPTNKDSSSFKEKYKRYTENKEAIQERIEDIQHKRDSMFGALFDDETLEEQFYSAQKIKDSKLTDQWEEKGQRENWYGGYYTTYHSYPNFATAKLSYIGKDGKLHVKSIKASHLSKSKAVKEYIKRGGTHSEGQVFEYVKELMVSETKYKKANKIVIDVHTKMDMCAVKSDKTAEGTCTKLACDLTTKYPQITIRVSYDFPHGYGQKSYNYLCQPCQQANSWTHKILPTASMLQYPIGEDFEYSSEEMNLEEVLGSTGGSRYTPTVEKAKKTHYQHVMDRFLADENLHTVEAGAGGNCFFHAIARQLEVINNDEEVINYKELRQFAIQYMTDHPDEFNGFTPNTLDEYIDQMSQNGTWADHPIIQALANEFQFEILIYRINGEINIIRGANPIRTVSIAYTGAHYLSVESTDNQQDENIERLVQAMGGSSLEDSQSATSSDKVKPSGAPTSMPTLAPTVEIKVNETFDTYEERVQNIASPDEYNYHSKVFAVFLGLDSNM
jgi:hypothetical protein